MNKQIRVSLPKNVQAAELLLFEPYLSYTLEPQKVKTFKNVFVTNSGFCLNNKGLIRESHHNHPDQFEEYQNEAAYHYYDAKENPENLIILDNDKTYLLIHHPWYNYYHWICESIFRAWLVRNKKDNMILLLPEYYKQSDFIMGSLVPFDFKNIFFIPPGKSLMVKTLCLPQIKSRVDSYHYKMMKEVKAFYLEHSLKVFTTPLNMGERIYISRKKANRKKVVNEEEIEKVLLRYNFTILNNEDFTFLEQVSIYSNAKYLVSIHGSGLTNMLFMKEGASIFEFHKRCTNGKDWHSKAFWYMAEALGYNYYQQICEPTEIAADYFNANIIVDSMIFEKNLARMFKL